MDTVRVASPWLLLVALPVWAVVLYAALKKGPGPRLGRRAGPGAVGRAVLTCLAAGLLAAALADPSVRVSREGDAGVLIVLDVSASMAACRSDEGPSAALAPLAASLPAGRVGLIRFAGGPAGAVAPGSPAAARLTRPDGFPPDVPPETPDAGETNIEQGLEAGAAALGPDQGILVLYTDARETRGDALRAAMRLAARGVQVHALLPDLPGRDAGVVSVAPMDEPVAGRPVRILVRVSSTWAGQAPVRLERAASGPTPARRWEQLAAVDPRTLATVLFEDEALPEGRYVYTAEVAAPGDRMARNDRARAAVRVGALADILYVHGGGRPGAGLDLLRRCAPPGAPVAAVRPDSAAAGALGASLVVLDNVAAWDLGEEAARRLARQVADGGTGLLVLGGDAAFAAGGYADSPLDALLPVTSRTSERPPIEIVLVVDSSGSMNQKAGEVRKLALAKQAVLSLRPALSEADRIGIVAFTAQPRVVSPLAPLAEWENLRARLVAIEASGGTRITPALEAAIALFPLPTPDSKTVRHMLLLSDGRSDDFDLARLADLARQARVSVSVVATGPDADRDRLGRLAAQARGRAYVTGDLGRLAETFLKDMAWARGDGLREETRPAVWVRPQPVWPAADGDLPPVPAWNATRAKEGADVHWAAAPPAGRSPAPGEGPREGRSDGPPLLATWRRGIGKVAAMPWPVSSAPDLPAGQAGAWTAAGALDRRLAPLVSWLAAARAPADWSARLVEREGRWLVRVEERPEAIGRPARPAGGSSAPFVAAVLGDGGAQAAAVPLAQVAPGVHEGAVGVRSAEAALVAVHRRGDAGALAHLSVPGLAPREFERLGVDRGRLEAIVRAGGGRIHTTPASLVEAVRRMEVRGFAPVGIHLVWTAGAVIALQVVLRLVGRL